MLLLLAGATAEEDLDLDFLFGVFFGDGWVWLGAWLWVWCVGGEVGGAQGGGTVVGVRENSGLVVREASEADPCN